MTETRKQCPVCGSDLSKQLGAELNACPRCRFPYAQVTQFADSSSLISWKQLVQNYRADLIQKLQNKCREERVFLLAGGSVVCKLMEERILALVRPDSLHIQTDPMVVQYSAAENASRNEAYLLANGTVRSMGDNSYSQCNTSNMTGIKRLLATPACTYGITKNGGVVVSGQRMFPAVENWKNIRDLTAGTYHLAGLTTDGRVLVTGNMLNPDVVREMKSWRDVTSVVAAGDATLALRKDGSVVFAGKAGNPRRAGVRQWTQITDIALESVYAVGLTSAGKVLLAGENRNEDLDMGRKDAANWTDIIAISCSRSGIGALGIDGTLHLVGNLREIEQIENTWEKIRTRFMDQLIRSVVDATSELSTLI